MKSKCLSALIIAVLCVAPGMVRGEEFVTSYWYGPPAEFATFERYQEIKEAGFNVVFPPALGNAPVAVNRRILDYCAKLGMRAVISDARMPVTIEGDAKKRIDAIVRDYSDHPALLAYYVVDEPSASVFPALGQVVAYLKQRDPKHPGYINLFPTYAAPGEQLGTQTYVEYVERFVTTVKPFVISFDHYPFISTGDRPDFFENLAVVRNASTKHGLGFWNIVLCTQHYDYRQLSEGELRFQAMHTLAFGGKGLLWYTYWYPGPLNPSVKHAMINHDGTRDPHFEMIKRINADARAMGNELMEAKSWATFHTGEPVLLRPPKDRSPVEPTGPGRLTTGVFVHRDGHHLAVIANRDYRSAIDARVRVEPASAAVARFDPTRQWSAAARDQAAQVALRLEPGGAVLLRWR